MQKGGKETKAKKGGQKKQQPDTTDQTSPQKLKINEYVILCGWKEKSTLEFRSISETSPEQSRHKRRREKKEK